MPPPHLNRDEVIQRLYEAFQTLGYEGATLSELSQKTGLGKSSLYHYFPGGKEDMAEAVLASIGEWMNKEVIQPLYRCPPIEGLHAMVTALNGAYDNGQKACVLANLTVGSCGERFQPWLNEAFTAWIAALQQCAMRAGIAEEDARQRAEMVVIVFEGALIVTRATGTLQIYTRATEQLPTLLLNPVISKEG